MLDMCLLLWLAILDGQSGDPGRPSLSRAHKHRRLGVKTRVFHLGDYRREHIGPGKDIPDDYFFVNGMHKSAALPEITIHSQYYLLASASSVLLRQKILKKCREDIYHFLNNENGQVAIYDAVNPLAAGRRSLAAEFAKQDIEVANSSRVRPLG